MGYSAGTPCDHFGVGTSANALKTTYSWLLEVATPGVLTNGTVTLPAPAWTVVPPAPLAAGQPPAPPVVVAQIAAPAPKPRTNSARRSGSRCSTTELEDAIGLEELVGDNAKVKQAETEVEWQLLQMDPGNPGLRSAGKRLRGAEMAQCGVDSAPL